MTLPQPVTVPIYNESLHKTAELTVSNAGFAAIFELHIGNTRIGYANCAAVSDHEYLICDLRIGSETEIAWPWRLIPFFRPRDHRYAGWGGMLLESIIQKARQHGFLVLLADVTPADEKDNRDLIGWYRKFGFVPSSKPAARPYWKRLSRRL